MQHQPPYRAASLRSDEPDDRWVGRRHPRYEDGRLVRGAGTFVGDVAAPGALHAFIYRSPIAAGRIATLDVSAARTYPDIIAVLTGDDVIADNLGGIPWEVCPPGQEKNARFIGDPAVVPPQPLLAQGNVHYVGEPIVLIVARHRYAALDAAEAIAITFEEHVPVLDVPAPSNFATRAPLFSKTVGDKQATEHAFAQAEGWVEITTHVPRLVPAPIEPRAYTAHFDATTDRWTLLATAGKPHPIRDTIATHVLHVEPARIAVIAPDIGGGFGGKNVAHAEAALVLWAARKVGAPISWICDRIESFMSDMQGRDHTITARLCFDALGRFTAISYASVVNLGAYLSPRGVIPCVSGLKVLTGPYRIEAAFGEVAAYFTNTPPTCTYRGAGAPETAFAIERLVDLAGRRLGIDPARMREMNLLQPSETPWLSPVKTKIHSVDFPAMLNAALDQAGYFEKRRAPRETGHIRRGLGLAFTVEGYGNAFNESAEIIVESGRKLEVRIGTKSSGQSHETTYAQILADALGIAPDDIAVTQGQTDIIAKGNGTGASRSLTTGGSAILRAASVLLDSARVSAAELMQCAPDNLVYEAGQFTHRNSPGSMISLGEIADASPSGRLHVSAEFRPADSTFPSGCHIAEVALDSETGATTILSYHAVQDAGVAINPMVVEGQLHGAIAQGIGAALMETMRFDSDSGQILTATFQDYAMPRAHNFTQFSILLQGMHCASNPLGAKPVGEAGTVTAPAAVINAIVDALNDPRIEDVDMPATPDKLWSIMQRHTS